MVKLVECKETTTKYAQKQLYLPSNLYILTFFEILHHPLTPYHSRFLEIPKLSFTNINELNKNLVRMP